MNNNNIKKESILVIDNYDSFTYNLVHLVNELGYDTVVWRNDKFKLEDVEQFERIILSPGPGIPSEAGLLLDVIRTYASSKKIMGVCLGQQAIAEAFGGQLLNLGRPMHGIATNTRLIETDEPLFKDIKEEFLVGRYHSWVVDSATLPNELKVTALDDEGQIMALRHRKYPVCGVQFHPESVLTPDGKKMMANWLNS